MMAVVASSRVMPSPATIASAARMLKSPGKTESRAHTACSAGEHRL
jgi:hypothetical protein